MGSLPASLPGFYEWLAQWVTRRAGAPVTAAELAALALPDFLRMNIRVVDAKDRVIAEGRDLAAIRKKLYGSGVAPAGSQRAGASAPGANGGGSSGAGRFEAASPVGLWATRRKR